MTSCLQSYSASTRDFVLQKAFDAASQHLSDCFGLKMSSKNKFAMYSKASLNVLLQCAELLRNQILINIILAPTMQVLT